MLSTSDVPVSKRLVSAKRAMMLWVSLCAMSAPGAFGQSMTCSRQGVEDVCQMSDGSQIVCQREGVETVCNRTGGGGGGFVPAIVEIIIQARIAAATDNARQAADYMLKASLVVADLRRLNQAERETPGLLPSEISQRRETFLMELADNIDKSIAAMKEWPTYPAWYYVNRKRTKELRDTELFVACTSRQVVQGFKSELEKWQAVYHADVLALDLPEEVQREEDTVNADVMLLEKDCKSKEAIKLMKNWPKRMAKAAESR